MSTATLTPCRRSAAPAKAGPVPGGRLDPASATPCGQRGIDVAHIPSTPLRLSHPGDAAEREADRAADRVMRGEQAQVAAAPPVVARKCAACEGAEREPSAPVPPAVAAAVEAPGQPLDPAVRADFEPRFGTSFADVRVHPDCLAARSIDASAFTLGRDIALAPGEYEPGTPAGRHLLAHELAHVAQQRGGTGVVHRQPYHTSGIDLPPGNLVNSLGYWAEKTIEQYDLTQSVGMANDPAEQEVVLAALWAANPTANVTAQRSQTVTVQPPPGPKGAARPALVYEFTFSPAAAGTGAKPRLLTRFVRNATGGDPAPARLPADYGSLTFYDLKLEKLRANPNPADRLGTVTMPPRLQNGERAAIVYAIWAYFEKGSARNTEVDAIIPLDAAGNSLMVTMRFGTNNDVVVTRIGVPGTNPPWRVNTRRIDVRRINGFPGVNADDAVLRTWWTKRYKKGGALTTTPAPAGASAPSTGQPPAPDLLRNSALLKEMSDLIDKGAATKEWFKDNYDFEIMTKEPAKALLAGLDPQRANLVADTRDFTPAELRSLEIALQLLGEAELTLLQKVKFARKSAGVAMTADKKWEAADVSGLAVLPGSDRIILFFDSTDDNDASLFRGGAGWTALPASTMTMVHEMGHVIAWVNNDAILNAFNAWERNNPQIPPTKYAQTRGRELFAEFYGLFRTDPHFLCSTAPLAFAWFTELAKTGKPPAANANLAPPQQPCPP